MLFIVDKINVTIFKIQYHQFLDQTLGIKATSEENEP